MDLGFDVVVTITGIVLVFLILVLLMAIITLEGKIFDGLGKKKAAAKAVASKPAAPAKPAAPVQQAIPATPVAAPMMQQPVATAAPVMTPPAAPVTQQFIPQPAAPTQSQQGITCEQIINAAMPLMNSNPAFAMQLQGILAKYGVQAVTQIPEPGFRDI